MPTTAFVGALLILPEGPRPLTLRIQGDTIIAVGGAPHPSDAIVDLTGYIIFPGLINALDKLEESSFPSFKMRTQYENAREWWEDLREQTNSEEMELARQSSTGDRLFIGALANILNGVTSVLHTGEKPGPFSGLRRLPINIIDCLSTSPPTYQSENLSRSFAQADPTCPWIIPLAECYDGTGPEEFRVLAEAKCLAPNTVLISVLDLGEEEIEIIHSTGTSIIWTPGANLHILGATHVHNALVNATAIGTGTRLMGSRGLLNELKLAQRYSQLPGRQIIKMVTEQSARILRQSEMIGAITLGGLADLVIVKSRGEDPYSQLIASERSELGLVISRGRPIIGARNMKFVFDKLQQRSIEVKLDRRPSLIAKEVWRRYRRIRINLRGLFST